MDTTQTAAAVFNKHARTYQEKFMDVSLYHDTLDVFCHLIQKQDAQILEIACGPGNITKYLLQQRPGYKILGTDLAPNMLELAKVNNPAATFDLMDGRNIAALNKQYHGIMCGFFLPYLSHEETTAFIHDAARVLMPGGVLYLSTMEDDYNNSGIKTSSSGDKLYMYYHEERQLVRALEANDFKIRHLQRKEYADKDGVHTTDLVIIAAL